MAYIYKLTGDYLKLYEMADLDGIDEQAWFDTMEGLSGAIEITSENEVMVMKQLESDKEGVDKEIKRLTEKSKALANRIAWIKQSIENSMRATGKMKFKTDFFSFNIQNNPPSVVIDEAVVDKSKLPEGCTHLKIDEVIDKKELLKHLKAGEEFEGVQMVQTSSLRIR